ncbi:MAG: DNA-binding domain-containing protein [Roseovarius sp.]
MSVSQTKFRGALLDGAAPVPEGLTDGAGRPAGRRFSVYRNNVAASLTEALELGFPAIRKLIGEENFRHIAGMFLRAHPPASPLISHYGTGFAEFLEGFEPLARYPYLGDVARLEQARREAYHAADAAPADMAPLQAADPDALEALRFGFAPALRLIRSRFPIHAIWAFNMEDGPKPQAQAQSVLVTRPEFDPVLTALSPASADCLAALLAGAPLGEAHAAAVEQDNSFDLGALLALLLGQNAITDIIPKDG